MLLMLLMLLLMLMLAANVYPEIKTKIVNYGIELIKQQLTTK
jgi:hypothetical protein